MKSIQSIIHPFVGKNNWKTVSLVRIPRDERGRGGGGRVTEGGRE